VIGTLLARGHRSFGRHWCMLVAGEGSFTPRGQIVPLVLPVALVSFPAEAPGPFLRLTFAAAAVDDLEHGARIAEMGAGRTMGPSWLDVPGELTDTDDRLRFWIDVAMEFNDRMTDGSGTRRPPAPGGA